MNRKPLFQNPVLLLFLGAVPALGASTDLRAALAMSAAMMAVLLCSTLLLGLLRRVIPAEAKLPFAILTVAGFAVMAQLMLRALLPTVYEMLGLYAAVLAVDLLLFGTAEDTMDLGLGKGLLGALAGGLVFALFICLLALIRELFGAASLMGHPVEALKNVRIALLTQPAGGLIVFSLLLAVVNAIVPAQQEGGAETLAAAGLTAEKKEA